MKRVILRSYVIVILSVIGLGILGQWFIQRALADLKQDGNLINLAGRQRMVSQMIVKDAALLLLEQGRDINEIDPVFMGFSEVHASLKFGDLEKSLKKLENDSLLRYYQFVNLEFEHFSKAYQDFKRNPNSENIHLLNLAQAKFLTQMDAFVFKASNELDVKLNQFQLIEAIVAIITFALILLELFVVFMPAFNQIKDQNERLKVMSFRYSHIIRRPLANILSLTWILKSTNTLSAEQVTQIELIDKEAKEIDQIVRTEVKKAEGI